MGNARERVEAALALDLADRPPVAAWGHDYEAEWDPERLGRVTVERARRLEFDLVKLQIRACCFAEALGAGFRYSGSPDREPVQVRPAVAAVEDWASLPQASAATPALAEQVRCLEPVVWEVGPDVPVIQTLFSPVTVGGFLVGLDRARMLSDLRARPDLVRPALERIAAALVDFARASLEAGEAGVFYAITGYASADAMPFVEYEELLLPLDRLVLDACSDGWLNMLHLCGPRQHFELVRRLPAHCVNWQLQDPGNPGLAEVRDRYRRAVVGGLHRRSPIADGTPDEVRRQAAAALAGTGGRGHVLTPGCSVSPWPYDREENFRALVESAYPA